jgi:hypothetical protein
MRSTPNRSTARRSSLSGRGPAPQGVNLVFYWIYDIPTWALAVLFAVTFVGVTWLGIVLTRPHVRRWVESQEDWNEVMGYVLSCHGVLYGILLGLIAVGTYQNFSDVEETVGKEASALAALDRDVSSYPEPIRGELRALLHEYCRFVIEDAWPAQRRGIIPEGGTARVSTFQRKLLTFEPATKGQEILHAATLHQFNVFVEFRRERLHHVTTALPPVLWSVVSVGAVIGIVLTWLFSIDRLSVHLAVAGLLSLLTGLIVFLIAAMDHPYRGDVSVSPEAFEIVQESLMAPREEGR